MRRCSRCILLLYIKSDDVSIFVCFFLVFLLKREIAREVSKIVNYEHESFRCLLNAQLHSLCPLVLLLRRRRLLLKKKVKKRARERETKNVF